MSIRGISIPPAGGGGGGATVPGGANMQVQFNDGGVFGGDAGFTYAKATDIATLVGGLKVPLIFPSADSTTAIKVTKADGTTDVLVIDTTNKRVGINTTPDEALHISDANAHTAILIENKESAVDQWPHLNITNYAGATIGHPWIFHKIAGGTKAAPASIMGSKPTGGMGFSAHDGTTFQEVGRIQAYTDTNFGPGSLTGFLTFKTRNVGDVTSEERMRITSVGDIAIGKNSASAKVDINGYIMHNGKSRTTAQFDKVDTALADIPGLSATLEANKTYKFVVDLDVDANLTGGHKYAMAGTAGVASIRYQITSTSNTTNQTVIASRQTALGGSAGQAGGTVMHTTIIGYITTNAAGTIVPQFAQEVANGTSSVLAGSNMIVEQL